MRTAWLKALCDIHILLYTVPLERDNLNMYTISCTEQSFSYGYNDYIYWFGLILSYTYFCLFHAYERCSNSAQLHYVSISSRVHSVEYTFKDPSIFGFVCVLAVQSSDYVCTLCKTCVEHECAHILMMSLDLAAFAIWILWLRFCNSYCDNVVYHTLLCLNTVG